MILKDKDKLKSLSRYAVDFALQKEYGFNTMHKGLFPCEWIKPGGLLTDIYHPTCDRMLSSEDIIKKREFLLPKYSRESFMFDRTLNMANLINILNIVY